MKVKYKIWMVVEEIQIDDDGFECYEDVDDLTCSVKEVNTLDEAIKLMESIHDENFSR